jgi:hypothetical protein
MEKKCRNEWTTQFLPLVSPTRPAKPREDTFLRALMGLPSDTDEDDFHKYAYCDPTPIEDLKTFNLITWWDNAKATFPSLYLYALDTLAIPAISAECERVFSSTKKLITPERNRLTEDIIEASEYLKNWWDHGLIKQQDGDEEAL